MSDDAPLEDRDGEEMEAFRGRTTSGAVWTAFGYGNQQVIRLVANLILTRLLLVEYFGLMTLVGVVMVGVTLLSDIGIQASLIQNKRDDRGFVDTLWTIGVIRGVVLCLVAWALAGPIAVFYEEPALADMIRVAALGFVIDGFRSAKFYIHRRNIQLKTIVILEVAAQLAGAIVMLIWASVSPTVWALVSGGLVTSAAATVWSHVALSGRGNRFHFERAAAVELYHFGRWIFVSTLLSFIFANADRIIFGKLVTMTMLGVYSIGANLAALPALVLLHIQAATIFPLYSRYHQRGAILSTVFQSARFPMLVLGGWGMAGIIAGGPTIIRVLYDPRYWDAGWMMQILAAGLWFRILEFTNASALLALGQTRWGAMVSGTKVAAMAALMPIGWHLGGFSGTLLSLAVSDLLYYLVSLWGVLSFGLDDRRSEAKLTGLVAVSAFGAWLVVQGLVALGWTNVFFHAAVIFIVVSAMWAPQHLKVWRRYRATGHIFFTEEEV